MSHAILLVDDEPRVLQGLTRALHKESYQILTANSALEAANVLQEREIDLIVSDEEMPGMSGTEFLAGVARDYPDIVRIVLTGHPTVPAALRAINEGRVYQFFTKPCNEIDLAVTIRRALEQRDLLIQSRELLEVSKRQSTLIEQARLLRRLRGGAVRKEAAPAESRPAPLGRRELLAQIGAEVNRGRALLDDVEGTPRQ